MNSITIQLQAAHASNRLSDVYPNVGATLIHFSQLKAELVQQRVLHQLLIPPSQDEFLSKSLKQGSYVPTSCIMISLH